METTQNRNINTHKKTQKSRNDIEKSAQHPWYITYLTQTQGNTTPKRKTLSERQKQ